MGLLDTSGRRGALTGSLGSKLLSWCLTTSGFTYEVLERYSSSDVVVAAWKSRVVGVATGRKRDVLRPARQKGY